MPFEQRVPHPFTANGVRTYAPAASGVYGISNADEWIYIGEADDIQHALLAQMQDSNTHLMKRTPTGFVFEICDGYRRPPRRDQLIQEYGPICNRAVSRYS